MARPIETVELLSRKPAAAIKQSEDASMKDSKLLLIAVDDSEVSHNAVAYASVMIDGRPGSRRVSRLF
jgi:hypothetical protein